MHAQHLSIQRADQRAAQVLPTARDVLLQPAQAFFDREPLSLDASHLSLALALGVFPHFEHGLE
jgi:hypothetical protein